MRREKEGGGALCLFSPFVVFFFFFLFFSLYINLFLRANWAHPLRTINIYFKENAWEEEVESDS